MNEQQYTFVVDALRRAGSGRVGNGPHGRRERFAASVGRIARELKGNIVEIGAGVGDSTLLFTSEAEAIGNKVLVIDPWPEIFDGRNNVYTYQQFCRVTGHPDNPCLVVCRSSSGDTAAMYAVAEIMPIAFGFADGLQETKEDVLKDLLLLASCDTDVICVDDMHKQQVRDAIREFINDDMHPLKVRDAMATHISADARYEHLIVHTDDIESYLLRKG